MWPAKVKVIKCLNRYIPHVQVRGRMCFQTLRSFPHGFQTALLGYGCAASS